MLHKASAANWFETVGRPDVGRVGGKNASLGEMVQVPLPKGIKVPAGFATTADAYWRFIDSNDLRPAITEALAEWEAGRPTLPETGPLIRGSLKYEVATGSAALQRQVLSRPTYAPCTAIGFSVGPQAASPDEDCSIRPSRIAIRKVGTDAKKPARSCAGWSVQQCHG